MTSQIYHIANVALISRKTVFKLKNKIPSTKVTQAPSLQREDISTVYSISILTVDCLLVYLAFCSLKGLLMGSRGKLSEMAG